MFFLPSDAPFQDPALEGAGFHDAYQGADSNWVPYAVILTKPPQGTQTPLQQRTIAASHELIEAATDPFPKDRLGWAGLDEGTLAPTVDVSWAHSPAEERGGEASDYCSQVLTPQDYPYLLSRAYSNLRASIGADPCGLTDSLPVMVSLRAPRGGLELGSGSGEGILDVYIADADAGYYPMTPGELAGNDRRVHGAAKVVVTPARNVHSGQTLTLNVTEASLLPRFRETWSFILLEMCPAPHSAPAPCQLFDLPISELPPVEDASLLGQSDAGT